MVSAQNDSAAKLQAANDATEQAFTAVLSAEKAGANVTELIAKLNNAITFLAHAENANRFGDVNSVISNADSAISISQQVTAQAKTAEESVTSQSMNAFWLSVGSVMGGSVLFILGLFLVWRLFERRYLRSLLDTQPEVTGN
ncbi:MAG: hypothetical protein NWF01_08170 [Candidatus Bathyarchaeota archaeon]|nr:hypothetical protein [Candidatus Bathyarchaeota archaeon]